VLTVGAIGLRKGSPYVLEAAKHLRGSCDFRMVGAFPGSAELVSSVSGFLELTGTVSRDRIEEHYAWADVFLLPSVCEGSATVIYEALGRALPVITTPNSGSVVTDGREGFVVPIRDSGSIVSALSLLARDASRYAAMSAAAISTAREYSFDRYADRLVVALAQLAHRATPA
jgi:glycosyltransferase involved in cell wall biosynthesis